MTSNLAIFVSFCCLWDTGLLLWVLLKMSPVCVIVPEGTPGGNKRLPAISSICPWTILKAHDMYSILSFNIYHALRVHWPVSGIVGYLKFHLERHLVDSEFLVMVKILYSESEHELWVLTKDTLYPACTNKNSQVGVYYTLYHCHIETTNSMTNTESLQLLQRFVMHSMFKDSFLS